MIGLVSNELGGKKLKVLSWNWTWGIEEDCKILIQIIGLLSEIWI